MNREQLEALWAQLTGDWSKPESVQLAIDTLKAKAHWLFQGVYNLGHAAATAENKSTIERLEGELDTAKKDADKARKAKEKAEEGNPDAAKVRAELEPQIQTLQQQLDDERKGRRQDRVDSAAKRAQTQLQNLLGSRIDAVLARAHVLDPAVTGRIRVSVDDNGNETVQVLQKGLTVPMTQENPLEALAEEIVTTVDPKFHLSGADRGAGARRGGGGGGNDVYEKIREDAKKEQEERASRSGIPPLLERLGAG